MDIYFSTTFFFAGDPHVNHIVLNESDWWVSRQWETFQPKNRSKSGWFQYAKKYTKLKRGFIVRYADDFKIMCSIYGETQRFYHSTVDFLNKRLKLGISPEKSKSFQNGIVWFKSHGK